MEHSNVAVADDLIAGVDIGGAFTDLTIHDPAIGAMTAVKAPSDATASSTLSEARRQPTDYRLIEEKTDARQDQGEGRPVR